MAGLRLGVRTGGFGGAKHMAEGLSPQLVARLAANPQHAGVPRTSRGTERKGRVHESGDSC